MRRSRKLPSVNAVSHLETHHAYISPPLPEKGGLPTIIVTPAEASTISEFEIHFYSPKPTQPTFHSQGFLPRVRSFFRRPAPMPSAQALLEKAEYFDDEEDIADEAKRNNIPRIVVTSGDYHAIRQSEDADDEILPVIPGVPTISEEQWSNIRASSNEIGTGPIALPMDGHHQPSRLITRRVRTLLFLSVPVAIVAFHLITHQMGLFRVDAPGFWPDESMEAATPIGGPSL